MRRLLIGLLTASALVWAPQTGQAEDVGLELELDRSAVTAGQVVEARVNVSGDIDMGSIDLTMPPGLTGSRSGSFNSITVVNGRMTKTVRQSFHIVADAPGTYVIGPAIGVHEGDAVQSGTVTLTVQSAAVEPQAGAVFVEAVVDNSSPYVGEQVTYSFKLYRPVRSSMVNLSLVPPETSGLWFEALDEEAAKESSETTIDGEPYDVLSVKRVYFPVRPGELTIGPSALTYQEPVASPRRQYDPFDRRSIFDSPFFSTGRQVVPRRLVTEPITLDVQPLPPSPHKEEPIVGAFSLNSVLAENSVQVGESVTLELNISGVGNVRGFPSFDVPDGDSYKVYADEPETNVGSEGEKVTGEYRLRIAIVPREAGELTIPQISVPVFNPAKQEWSQLTTGSFTLQVDGASEAPPHILSASSAEGASVPVPTNAYRLAVDLLAPRPLPESLSFASGSTAEIAAIVAAPPILSLAVLLLRRKIERDANDPTRNRRRNAAVRAKKALRAVQPHDAEQIGQAIIDYIADRVGVAPGSITGDEALAKIEAATDKHGSSAARIIRAGEASRYGGEHGETIAVDEALALIEALEQVSFDGNVHRV